MNIYNHFFLILLLFSADIHAGNYLLNPQIGIGKIRIDYDEGGTVRSRDVGTTGASIYGGYVFDNNLLVNAGFSRQASGSMFGAFGSTVIKSYEGLVGYSFEKGDFYIRPQLGVTHWQLRFKPDLAPIYEDEATIKKKGNDLLLVMDAGYGFTDKIGIRFSYKIINTEVGMHSSSTVGVIFFF